MRKVLIVFSALLFCIACAAKIPSLPIDWQSHVREYVEMWGNIFYKDKLSSIEYEGAPERCSVIDPVWNDKLEPCPGYCGYLTATFGKHTVRLSYAHNGYGTVIVRDHDRFWTK